MMSLDQPSDWIIGWTLKSILKTENNLSATGKKREEKKVSMLNHHRILYVLLFENLSFVGHWEHRAALTVRIIFQDIFKWTARKMCILCSCKKSLQGNLAALAPWQVCCLMRSWVAVLFHNAAHYSTAEVCTDSKPHTYTKITSRLRCHCSNSHRPTVTWSKSSFAGESSAEITWCFWGVRSSMQRGVICFDPCCDETY